MIFTASSRLRIRAPPQYHHFQSLGLVWDFYRMDALPVTQPRYFNILKATTSLTLTLIAC